jgi:hypothetical protein
VLLAGGGKGAEVRVEEQRGDQWVVLWRSAEAPSPAALTPQLTELASAPGKLVRVRVVGAPGVGVPLLVDAPTFVE